MITKERLKDLKEKNERVFILIDNKPISAKLNSLCNQVGYVDDKEHFILFDPDDSIISITNEDLFETKEDAEEYLKYNNIIREEKLELPIWSEVKEKEITVDFNAKHSRYRLCCIGERIGIIEFKDDTGAGIFYEPLTRENYDKARDLCIKLFMGEE